MKLNHADYPTSEFGEPSTSRFDEEMISRHHKVVDIGSAVFAVHHDFR
jgi:hypothetical protein